MSCARTLSLGQMSICISLFDLHGLSVVSCLLLYYTSLPLWTNSYPIKASTFNQGAILLRRGHPCPMDTYLSFVLVNDLLTLGNKIVFLAKVIKINSYQN